jgi:hypothetical protein
MSGLSHVRTELFHLLDPIEQRSRITRHAEAERNVEPWENGDSTGGGASGSGLVGARECSALERLSVRVMAAWDFRELEKIRAEFFQKGGLDRWFGIVFILTLNEIEVLSY